MDIDPGEVALSVIGVQAVISREVEKITAPQRREMLNLDAQVAKLARAVCRDSLEIPAQFPPSYRKLLEELTRPFNAGQVEAMIAPLPPETKRPFMMAAQRAFEYLQGRLPKSVYTTFAGDKQQPVSDPQFFQFCSLFQVLDDPLTVFGLIGGAAMLRSQVAAVRSVYPTLSAAIDEAMQDACATELAAKKSYQLPGPAEIGMATWEGRPIETKPFQAAYAPQAKRDPQPTQGGSSALAKESLSGAQAALYGQLK